MGKRFVKLVGVEAAPRQGIHFEPWDRWPPDLVVWQTEGRELPFTRQAPWVGQTLGGYLSDCLRTAVRHEAAVALIVSKAAEKVGGWVAETHASVTAALHADDVSEYMQVVVTDQPCLQVVRLRIEFHDEPGE